jgi:hypothetical protein
MANIFCPHCGSKAEYQFAAPNFCYKCGLPYSESRAVPKSQSPISRVSKSRILRNEDLDDQVEEDVEFDDDDSESTNINRVPRISKIQVEIDSSTDIRSYKFGDLVNGNSSSTFKRSKTVNLEDLLDERN